MRGRLKAREQSFQLAMYGAWQGERFAREEKLCNFDHYAKVFRRPRKQGPKDLLNVYREIAAAGVPLKITKLN